MQITTPEEYIDSLRGRGLNVWLMGERIDEPVDHPIIRPSINAVAETYRVAMEQPELATARSGLTGAVVNRFLHVTGSAHDVVMQNRMQRALGQRTGTCFQRCVGMDALNALYSVTHDIDSASGTGYHGRLQAFLEEMQRQNLVVGGAMTDPKGDRSKGPAQQLDDQLFLRIVRRLPDGVVVSGAKMHQTGCINSHWILVMPTQRLGPGDEPWAVVGAIPVTAKGLTFVYGRQSCDLRALRGGVDAGNARFGGQEAIILFDEVFIPDGHVFMDGEVDFAAALVERFTAYHRRSYVCKTGLGDVLIGAAAGLAQCHGVEGASHIKDKLVEMAHLNETVYGAGLAASHESHKTAAGNWEPDGMLANVCKHHVTSVPFDLARMAQDIAGGLVSTMPSDQDFQHPQLGPRLNRVLAAAPGHSVEERRRLLRLVENMTLGRNAVGYLTESVHGAGSPQAQRIQIGRLMDLPRKVELARKLAGVDKGV